MARSFNLYYGLILVLIYRASTAPLSQSSGDPICSSAQLVAPGKSSLVYKYKTEVKMSVVNGQYDLKTEVTADVHIKNLGECKYALQLRNVEVTEVKDQKEETISSPALKELENLVVRFRWVDGFLIGVDADASASVDHVNFVKGILSALQVYSPVPSDKENIVREEDVLGVCTTQYKYTEQSGGVKILKNKDLSTCSKDKLHLSSSPVLTSLLGPIIEEAFAAKTHYVCQTEISDKKIKSVKCKTIEIESEDGKKSSNLDFSEDNHVHEHDSSSEEETTIDFDENDEEISSKVVSIKQQLDLQTTSAINIDAGAVKNPVRQTLQFVPTTTFDKSNTAASDLISKLQGLLKSKDWDQFAASGFVEIANELRRMDKAAIDAFKSNGDIKNLVPTFLSTIYAHDPAASLLNFDSNTLKFANPLSVYYLDSPSTDLVDKIIEGAKKLTDEQVPDFIGLASTILKKYKARGDNYKDADSKIEEFHKAISKFLANSAESKNEIVTATLGAYAQLGLYDDNVRSLAVKDDAPLNVQYNVLNVIRHINDDFINDNDELNTRTDLQNILLRKLQNKSLKNAVRVWAFNALYTPFIYNPEGKDTALSDSLEQYLSTILEEPLNQVNGYIWSVLRYSSLNRIDPLRGLAARLRNRHSNKKQFSEQSTLSSRYIELKVPLRKNYQAYIEFSTVFENDRSVPSFISINLAFDGVRRETLRLPWFDGAAVIENLDWNVADYFLRLDPLAKTSDDAYKQQAKQKLSPGVNRLQQAYDEKEEDADPSVYFYAKLFGANIRSNDVTEKVLDILRSNLRSFIKNKLLDKMKDLAGKSPIFRIPFEIGAASAAANGLTLYKSFQFGLLADLTSEFKSTMGDDGAGIFKLTSKSVLSCSITIQREVASPLTAVGETVQIGAMSNVPFEYSVSGSKDGRTREFNFLNSQSTALATDFQYLLRTSKGIALSPNPKSLSVDPSCTPSAVYRALGVRLCLELNPFRSIQLGSRPSYPMKITLNKDSSIQKWRIGWRFAAPEAPQYEVVIEKVGATATYPGLGVSATKTDNKFDIRVLTGMKSFTVKGTLSGNSFGGSIYSSENKEVMTTSGTLSISNDGFTLNSKAFDVSSKKEVLALKTDIQPNRGKGLKLHIDLSTPDKSKSFGINFHGDLYKKDHKLFHLEGNFNLVDVMYSGKVHLERSDNLTRIEFRRLLKFQKGAKQTGYDLFYERKTNKDDNGCKCNVASHFSLRTPMSDAPMKIIDVKADMTNANDYSSATLQSSVDVLLMTRSPPVSERIEVDYSRKSVRTNDKARQLLSPEGSLKLQVKTKSNVFNFLFDHRHKRSMEASKKGPAVAPPTFNIANKIHITADSDKLFPDIPRPFAFDVLSDLDFQLLNEIKYKFQYELRRRQASGSFTYRGSIDKVTDGHLFSGTSESELLWDNKQKKAVGKGAFSICAVRRSIKSHWDIDTNLVEDKNDVTLDFALGFDDGPKAGSPKSLILSYDVKLKAPKHPSLQLIDIDGNVTKQDGKMETFNSIAVRSEKKLKEYNLNARFNRNLGGDGTLNTHLAISLPFKNLPYITHDLKVKQSPTTKRISYVGSRFLAKPVLAHYASISIDRSNPDKPPHVHVENELEYLRTNGHNLYALSRVDVQRWSKLHTFGLLQRNNDLLHKHSIGYIISTKTRRVALSLESPQLSGNPLSIIGELTIDRENRIGKMKWPQEFGVHFEFGTPISKLMAFKAFYNLPMFGANSESRVDGALGFKLASPKIAPIGFYLRGKGSFDTTLHVTESVHIGDDIKFNSILTAQYNPQLISQISATTSAKFYDTDFQNTFYALMKQHQITIRGVVNTTDNEDYRYEMDFGFDEDLLTGHTERAGDGKTIESDVSAAKCTPTGQYKRCYKGDISVKSGDGTDGKKGSFDFSWGVGTAKLDIKVPERLEIKFDHTHSGRVRDEDFSSKTTIEGKSLRADDKRSFSYSGSLVKDNGKVTKVEVLSSSTDKKTGKKSVGSSVSMNQKIIDKSTGQFQRNVNVKLEKQGLTLVDWSSEAVSCKGDPTNVLQGMCQTSTFTLKASNIIAKRLRQRLQLPEDPRLADPTGQVPYDGTMKLDLKFDPRVGPSTLAFDLNRMKEDAADFNVSFQPRYSDQPMSVTIKANLPRQNPISVKYDETRRSETNFQGVLKYSFNANDNSAEKTYQCEVDRPDSSDVSITCRGERTTLTIDIDRKAGKSKVYVDLNRFEGERIGYEYTRNPETNELDATLYTLISSWNVQRQPGKSTTLSVKQKGKEVLRVEGTKVSDQEIQVKVSPADVNLKLEWDASTLITLKQTSPQQRDLLSIVIDRARIRPYLPSLRNQNRPSLDIERVFLKSAKPLVEIAFDSNIFLSLSNAADKIASHNGLYGLDTIKKAFKLQIGDAPLTIYNIQHWKTHKESTELPESYSIRIVNDVNANFVQLATYKWNENRFISKISHSFDGGKTSTTDLKLNRNYALQVGSVYFFHSLGYRNIEGARQLRNFTRNFVCGHIMKDLETTNLAGLVKAFRQRLRSILDVDYAGVKAVVAAWNQEPEKSFLRQLSARLGLSDFFERYPKYGEAADRVFAILRERAAERDQFWRERFEALMNENRLKDVAERLQARRLIVMKRLSDRAEKILDRILPKVDQTSIDKRISDYAAKILAGCEQILKRNTEQWKAIFKAIDDASKVEDAKWFRTLVADIDSAAFATVADAETSKVIKKLSDSSKLIIGNIQQLSRGITKRREAIRERVKNAIEHFPKAYLNGTDFELLVPVGSQPRTYADTSALMLGIGSLLRNRDQAIETIRAILTDRYYAEREIKENYEKARLALKKRLLQRNPSLTPEFYAVLTPSGDGIDVHGHYMYLNPSCSYILSHDFADLQFSFNFVNGKVQSTIPTQSEIKDFECSNTGRIQICNRGGYYTLNIPMHYGGRVDGALGDVRDRSTEHSKDLSRWLLSSCPDATSEQPKSEQTIPECANDDDDKQKFCENFVQSGIKSGKNKRILVALATQACESLP